MADSYHSSVHTMLEESREAGESTSFDRMDDMGTRCKFCEQGIRCSLCSQGPCRHHREGAARRLRHRRRRHGDAQLPAAEHDGHRHLHLPRHRGHEDPRAGEARRHLRDQGLGQARDCSPASSARPSSRATRCPSASPTRSSRSSTATIRARRRSSRRWPRPSASPSGRNSASCRAACSTRTCSPPPAA